MNGLTVFIIIVLVILLLLFYYEYTSYIFGELENYKEENTIEEKEVEYDKLLRKWPKNVTWKRTIFFSICLTLILFIYLTEKKILDYSFKTFGLFVITFLIIHLFIFSIKNYISYHYFSIPFEIFRINMEDKKLGKEKKPEKDNGEISPIFKILAF